ncbi:hypothetical protein Micbo1qcDRAFT_211083 [Microdochium bolleyi]|uniref:Uncharacterized protein n=1 Tax=Microdochium bolleyi TaxID=196109 RepID=A0A136JI76_9PEZI|nr:hypothetical protein Micbo1qcDRAFT_211083 [Microdochium bolleyi]
MAEVKAFELRQRYKTYLTKGTSFQQSPNYHIRVMGPTPVWQGDEHPRIALDVEPNWTTYQPGVVSDHCGSEDGLSTSSQDSPFTESEEPRTLPITRRSHCVMNSPLPTDSDPLQEHSNHKVDGALRDELDHSIVTSIDDAYLASSSSSGSVSLLCQELIVTSFSPMRLLIRHRELLTERTGP